jgi:nucleoside-diphosphate-sugar epimerase
VRALIIGCGYVGLLLGERLARAGHAVTGLRRTAAADAEMERRGIRPIHADIACPGGLAAIGQSFDWVINLASSTRGGLADYNSVYLEGTCHVLEWLRANPPRRYIHASSTSVYGQNDASVVTEESPAEPESETSKVLREMETLVLREAGLQSIVPRISGIYGPGRGHLFKQYRRGEAVMREDGSTVINMVHVEDVAGAIEHCVKSGASGEIYNLTDDEPVTQFEFFTWLSKTLGRPMPPSAPSDPIRKRGLTNKRVSNAKLKKTGYRFQFPTFREGYTAEILQMTS